MTSDAKVGLLLGLVFVVIIAFLINGLPNLLKADESQEQLLTSIDEVPTTLVIGEEAKNAGRKVLGMDPREALAKREISLAEARATDPRFSSNPPSTENTQISGAGSAAPTASVAADPKVGGYYVVRPGDNLAEIAKKCYGPDKGNKHETVKRLYEANKNVLPSPDKVKSGQKLLIPALSVTQTRPKTVSEAKQMGFFETVASLPGAWKRAGEEESKPAAPKQRVYVVQEKDTIWNIAQKHLGNGSRYKEIVQLNKDKLTNPNDIEEGMRLVLPAR